MSARKQNAWSLEGFETVPYDITLDYITSRPNG